MGLMMQTARRAAALLAFAAAAEIGPAFAAPPLVFAHYMHCFVPGVFSSNDEHVAHYAEWYGKGGLAALAVESQWFDGELAAKITRGLPAVQEDMARLERSGVNAIGLLLTPSLLPDSAFAHGLNLVAYAASNARVKIVPELWDDLRHADIDAFAQKLSRYLDAHPGAQLSLEGKPVFLISPQEPDGGGAAAEQETARRLDRLFARWGGRKGVYLIVDLDWMETEIAKNSYVGLADALGGWSPQDDWTSRAAVELAGTAARAGKPLVYPVAFNFYQRRAGRTPWEYGNGFGAARLIDAWSEIAKRKPPFVELETWNDFSEDTAFTPTSSHDATFMDLNAYFARRQAGAAPAPRQQVMILHPRQLAAAKLDAPDAVVHNYEWRHVAPVVDYLDVVTILQAPGEVRVEVGDATWTRTAPAGLSEWLLIAPLPSPRAGGDRAPVRFGSYPRPDELRAVQRVEGFPAARPRASVVQGGKTTLSVESRAPFADRGAYQDFTVIADESDKP